MRRHSALRDRLRTTRFRVLSSVERLEDRALMATLLGVTTTNSLIRFDSATSGTVQTTPITGIGGGQSILGTDIRPATGQFYALTGDAGNVGRVYTIDTATGVATLQATLAADPADLTNPYTSLSGASFGVDFNPVPDRLRVVSNSGQNLRINVATGLVTTDASINPGAPAVVGVAYTNSFAGATATTLYDIDSTTDTLSIQTPPNNGTLTPVGSLGVDAGSTLAFDILATGDRTAPTNLGFASLNVGGSTGLYSINLATGAATLLGPIGTGTNAVIGLSALPDTTLLPSVNAIGVDAVNNLIRFNGQTPGTIQSSTPITGLQIGETILGLDFRPATGGLYALGNTGRVYTINPATAAVTATVVLAADPADTTSPFTTLSGTSFGVDFNPVPDRLRVVSNTGQNLRINVDTGLVTTDATLNPGTPDVVGVAYTNSFVGATTTSLYDIDAATDTLTIQTPPNNGTLVTVGPLGVNASEVLGFDIRAANNTAIAALTVGGTSGLYSINLTTGAATLIGNIGGAGIVGLALVPNGTLNFSAPVFTVLENQAFATITVTRVGGTDGVVSVNYATSAGTATPGQDYTNVSGTLTFASGDATAQTFTVPIVDDANFELFPNETINLALSGATGGAVLGATSTAQLQIVDNEPRTVSIGDTVIREFDGVATFTISLNSASGVPITVLVNTVGETATSGVDFTPLTNTLITFAPGVTTQTVSIGITQDTIAEVTERFSVVLSGAVGGIIGKSQGEGTIVDDDAPLIVTAGPIALPENANTGLIVATFVDPDGVTPGLTADGRVITTTYFASILWNDGSSRFDTVVPTIVGNQGTVIATHAFPRPGVFAVKVDVSKTRTILGIAPAADQIVTSVSTTAFAQATISDAEIRPIVGTATTATQGVLLNAVVAQFEDSGIPDLPGSYTATIDWGDGSPTSLGIVVVDPPVPGSFRQLSVQGTHRYDSSGNFIVTTVLASQYGSVATSQRIVPVTAIPQFLSAILNPASDSGLSNTDKITNVSLPNFIGYTLPGSTVRIFAQAPGGAVNQVGQGSADSAGYFSTTVTVPLADGTYVIIADSLARGGSTPTSFTITNALVIDTVGPRVNNLQFNRLNGTLQLVLQDDRSGLDRSTVIDGNNYLLSSPRAKAAQTRATSLQAPIVGATGLETVSLFYNRGAKLPFGVYRFSARSGGIVDVAGNGLDGEYYGYFPSGNAKPGGDFVALISAFHRITQAPQPVNGFATPLSPPGTRPTTTVFGANATQATSAIKKTKAVVVSPISLRKVHFTHQAVAAKLGHSLSRA